MLNRWNYSTLKASKQCHKLTRLTKNVTFTLAMTPNTITIHATPHYQADQSDPEREHYLFAYTIRITNTGTVAVQLISRHWIITDGNLRVEEVRGLGVVGEQPLIRPGETYEYSSGCQLETPVGTMRGNYQMVAEDGTSFEAEIPEFTLSIPRVLH